MTQTENPHIHMYGFAFASSHILSSACPKTPSLFLPLSLVLFISLSLSLVTPLSSPVAGVELLISTAMNTLPKDGEGRRESCVCVCRAVLFLSHQLIPGDALQKTLSQRTRRETKNIRKETVCTFGNGQQEVSAKP